MHKLYINYPTSRASDGCLILSFNMLVVTQVNGNRVSWETGAQLSNFSGTNGLILRLKKTSENPEYDLVKVALHDSYEEDLRRERFIAKVVPLHPRVIFVTPGLAVTSSTEHSGAVVEREQICGLMPHGGTSLGEFLDPVKDCIPEPLLPRTPEMLGQFNQDMSSTLDFFEKNLLIHRDLFYGNVLWNGNNFVVIDFGKSMILEPGKDWSTHKGLIRDLNAIGKTVRLLVEYIETTKEVKIDERMVGLTYKRNGIRKFLSVHKIPVYRHSTYPSSSSRFLFTRIRKSIRKENNMLRSIGSIGTFHKLYAKEACSRAKAFQRMIRTSYRMRQRLQRDFTCRQQKRH